MFEQSAQCNQTMDTMDGTAKPWVLYAVNQGIMDTADSKTKS
jgi:hypothetical protein